MKLHIFIDGTWLFRACSKGKVLASKTETPSKQFSLDFEKLNSAIQKHLKVACGKDVEIGDCYISSSIIDVPAGIDDLPLRDSKITHDMIDRFKKGVFARNMFIDNAIKRSVYKDSAIFRPQLKSWMIPKIANGTFQEKQVDTTVVALLVKYAIKHTDDFHAVLTGDSDILPAIRIAYPEYTKNVLVVSTDPDELKAEWRQSSFSISNFDFQVPAMYLQEYTEDIIFGSNVYRCKECNKVFVRDIKITRRPYCQNCEAQRT